METKEHSLQFRGKLVRSVAAMHFQSLAAEKKQREIKEAIIALENKKSKFLQEYSDELVTLTAEKNLQEKAASCQQSHDEFMASFEAESGCLKASLSEEEENARSFNRKKCEALKEMVADVLAGKYGKGELYCSSQGIARVFGRLKEREESLHNFALSLKSNVHNVCQFIKQIAEMCEDGAAPLFHIDISLMPLDESEAAQLCRENEKYLWLKQHIALEFIPWKLNNIYRINEDNRGSYAVYLVVVGPENCAVVKVEKGIYPEQTAKVLGKLSKRNEHFIENELKYWDGETTPDNYCDGSERCEWPLAAYEKSQLGIVCNMLSKHLWKKYPGLILHWPQFE